LNQAARDADESAPQRESNLFTNNAVGLGILQQPKPTAARLSRWFTELRQSLPSPRSPLRRPSVLVQTPPYHTGGKDVDDDDDDDDFSDTSSILSPATFATRHSNSTYLPPTALTHPSMPKLLSQQRQQQPQQQPEPARSSNTTTTITSSSSRDDETNGKQTTTIQILLSPLGPTFPPPAKKGSLKFLELDTPSIV
jgi:hypothetical protein